MKKFWSILWMLPIAAVLAVGCQSDDITYSGPEYVSFSDTLSTMPILNMDTTFSVPVTATTIADYDRNYAVEVVDGKTTAVRGLHYDFVDNSSNITIKAGERTAFVKLKGYYDNVLRDDSLVINLRLIEPKSQKWDLYGNETRVNMVKCHPFKMNDFLMIKDDQAQAQFTMMATFPFGEQTSEFDVKGYKKDDKTLMLTDMFGSANLGDIRVIFDDSDPLNLEVTVPEQPAFRDVNYGTIWVRSVVQYPSYFNTFDNFFVLILDAYVPQIGSFGVYQYIFKCLSPDEAANEHNGAVTRGIADRSLISTFKTTDFSLKRN